MKLYVPLLLLFTTLLFQLSTFSPSVLILLFVQQYEQFSLTVRDAALQQQKDMRDGLQAFANLLSSSAKALNQTWPEAYLPDFEVHAGDFRTRTGAEMLGLAYYVEEADRESYLSWVDANYEERTKEGHLMRYGDTNFLTPTDYYPFIHKDPTNGQDFTNRVPVNTSDFYFPYATFSPPLVQYTLLVRVC